MTLSAEYADQMACIHCGSPAKKLGDWSVADGEFFFKPRPVIVDEWFGTERPHNHPERWQQVEHKRISTDREGVSVVKTEKRWSVVATHVCMAHMTGETCAHELLTSLELSPYHGPFHDKWMSPPAVSNAPWVKALKAEVYAMLGNFGRRTA